MVSGRAGRRSVGWGRQAGLAVCSAVLGMSAVPTIAQEPPAPPPAAPASPTPPGNDATDDRAAYTTAKARAAEALRAGRLDEARQHSEASAALAETLYGPDAVETAITIHNHGFVLRRLKRDPEAEPLLARALASYERKLPAVNEDIRNVVGELGQIYVATGRGAMLADIYARLIARAEAEGFAEHIGTAHMLANQGFVLRGLKREEDSEAAFIRAVDLYERLDAITGEPYRTSLEALLGRFEQTRRLDLSEARAKAALSKLAAKGPAGATTAARLANRLSQIALDAGRVPEATAQAEAAVAYATSIPKGVDHGGVDPAINALNSLARAHRAASRYGEAEKAYQAAIAKLEAAGDQVNAGIVTDNLAVLYVATGRLADGERTHKRALALLEAARGPNHRNVGRVAANLGAMLIDLARYGEAEAFLKRGLAIAEADAAPDAVGIGIIEDNLAGLYRMTGRPDDARASYARALARFESVLPPVHPRLATARNNIGRFLLDQKAFAEAEAQLRKAVALAEQIYGRDHISVAVPLSNLAEALVGQKGYDEARGLLARSIAIAETAYGKTHPSLVITFTTAAKLEMAESKPAAARPLFERAVEISLALRARGGPTGASSGASGGPTDRDPYLGLIEAIWASAPKAAPNDIGRALEVAQWDGMTSAAVALASLGARAGAGDPALAALTRERQDLAAEWTSTDRLLTQRVSRTGQRDATAETALRDRLSAIETRMTAIDGDLAQRFPRYHDLVRPKPLNVEAIRATLAPNEAVVQIVSMRDVTHVFLVSRTALGWQRIVMTERELKTLVGALRCGLDQAEWQGDGLARCVKRLGFNPAAIGQAPNPLPFSVDLAHSLYTILFGRMTADIAGKDLLIVASGALTSLPFQVLVTEKPAAEYLAAGDRVAWLAERHAVTVLPSLASLEPLRKLAKASAARRSFVGIGNPLLVGADGLDRRAWETPACVIAPAAPRAVAGQTPKPKPVTVASAKPRPARSTAPPLRMVSAGGLDLLRRQVPLPETVDELCRVARFTGGASADVVGGAEATETGVKAMSDSGRLADARVVHFATHGLLAGETAQFLASKAEPSLLLTPPETASDTDDGLLTASEVANLRLDADWVVLSACNTASGDDIGAEALSGLARAFFYAGARSLLVSHWAVDSESTVKLVTSAFEAMGREPGLSQGQALSRAMAALIGSGGREAHPSNWAPFVVVGGSAPVATPVAAPLAKPTAATPTKPAAKPESRPSAPRPALKPKPPSSPEDDWRSEALGG